MGVSSPADFSRVDELRQPNAHTERAPRVFGISPAKCRWALSTARRPPYSRAPGPSRGCCRLVAARLALLDEEVRAPILRPARLIVVRALRPLLSVTDDRDTPSGDTLGHEVVHRRLRATLPQCQVVFIGSPLVTVPLDQEKVLLVGLEPTCILIEEVRVRRTDRVLVEVEVDVREVAHGDKITRSRPAPRRRRRPRLTGRTRSPRVGGRLSRSRIAHRGNSRRWRSGREHSRRLLGTAGHEHCCDEHQGCEPVSSHHLAFLVPFRDRILRRADWITSWVRDATSEGPSVVSSATE